MRLHVVVFFIVFLHSTGKEYMFSFHEGRAWHYYVVFTCFGLRYGTMQKTSKSIDRKILNIGEIAKQPKPPPC